MNTKQAAAIVGATYNQANYLIEQKVIFPEKIPGKKARKFYLRDLIDLALAMELRKDGFRLDGIRQALSALDDAWKTENPEEAGKLVVLNNGFFEWRDSSYMLSLSTAPGTSIPSWPGVLYDVRSIALRVFGKFDRWLDGDEKD